MPITEESRKTMKVRGAGKKGLALEAIRLVYPEGGELEFLKAAVKASLDNPALLGHILDRIDPKVKSSAATIVVEFPPGATPSEKAESFLDAIANGDIPPDIGATMIGAVKQCMEIEIGSDLIDRLEQLESSLVKRLGELEANG